MHFGGWRGGKYSAFEAGSRVPFLVSWPAVIKGGQQSDALIGQVDLLASFAGQLGVFYPKDQAVDSQNQWKALTGTDKKGRTYLVKSSGFAQLARNTALLCRQCQVAELSVPMQSRSSLIFMPVRSAGIPQTGFPFPRMSSNPELRGTNNRKWSLRADWQPGTASSPGHTAKQSYGTNYRYRGAPVACVTATGCQGQEFYAQGRFPKTNKYDENNPLRLREGSVEEFGDLAWQCRADPKMAWMEQARLDTYMSDMTMVFCVMLFRFLYIISQSVRAAVDFFSSAIQLSLLTTEADDREESAGREWSFLLYNKLGLQKVNSRRSYSRCSTYGNEAFPRQETCAGGHTAIIDDYRFAQAQEHPASGLWARNTTANLTAACIPDRWQQSFTIVYTMTGVTCSVPDRSTSGWYCSRLTTVTAVMR
ncbi:hypothetical protein FQR65_LT16025 [Abscondita terminalis]|nr:hypothetical protein FQR65_LT16025 [Abscondita terminalis]